MPVHQLKDGRWYAKWRVRGKQKKKYFGRGEGARRQATSFDNRRKLDSRPMTDSPNLADLALDYSKHNKLHRDTLVNIFGFLKRVSFSDTPVKLLTRRDITTMRQDLDMARVQQGKPPLSNATKNRAQAYISRLLNWGVEQGYLVNNPWARVPKLKERKRIPTATLEDFTAIYKAVSPRSEYLRWAMIVIYATANRPGLTEIFSLKWRNFDLDRGICMINQAKSGAPKVSILPEGFIPLALARRQADLGRGIEWVVHRRGRQVKSYKEAWWAAKKRAGLGDRDIVFYDLRHVLASTFFARGADPAAVQNQLGHLWLSTTTDTYVHAVEGAQRHAVGLLPEITTDPTVSLLSEDTED